MEAFLMSMTVSEGIAIGSVRGAFAGLAIWLVQLLKEKVLRYFLIEHELNAIFCKNQVWNG
jgi:hypothetical protein